jgi:uncharacterized RDD family membrane protein YckC
LILLFYVIIALFIMAAVDADMDSYFILIMTIGLPLFLYHLMWETFWNGRSPGKAVMKLRVVKVDGSRPAFSSFLLRWLLRIIDISLTSGAVALITILFNGRGQRWGDMAAKTTVITEKQTMSLSRTILMDLPEGYQPTYPQVTVFTDAEMQTIKSLFMEAKRNGNHNVILKLALKVTKVMEATNEETPIKFLDTVIMDYNYFTQQM